MSVNNDPVKQTIIPESIPDNNGSEVQATGCGIKSCYHRIRHLLDSIFTPRVIANLKIVGKVSVMVGGIVGAFALIAGIIPFSICFGKYIAPAFICLSTGVKIAILVPTIFGCATFLILAVGFGGIGAGFRR